MMYAIDPTMSFAQVVQYYKDLSLIHISEPTRH